MNAAVPSPNASSASTGSGARCAAHFGRYYSDPKIREDRQSRFEAAWAYYWNNREMIEEASGSILGSAESGDAVSSKAVDALYRFFGFAPLEDFPDGPPIEDFLMIVRGEL